MQNLRLEFSISTQSQIIVKLLGIRERVPFFLCCHHYCWYIAEELLMIAKLFSECYVLLLYVGTKVWIMLTSGHHLPNGARLCQELLIGAWSYCCVNEAGAFIGWLTNGEYVLSNKGYLMTAAHRVAWIIIFFWFWGQPKPFVWKMLKRNRKRKVKKIFLLTENVFHMKHRPVICLKPILPLFVLQNIDLLLDKKVLPSNVQCPYS